MLVIRFQRVGKKKQASFRIVLQEKSWKPQGKIKELLGFYNPHSKEKKLHGERISYWIEKGAQLSPTVHNLLVDEGIIKGRKMKAWAPKKKKTKEEAPAEGEVKAEGEKEEAVAEKPAPEETKKSAQASEGESSGEQEKKKQEEPKDDKPADDISNKQEAAAIQNES